MHKMYHDAMSPQCLKNVLSRGEDIDNDVYIYCLVKTDLRNCCDIPTGRIAKVNTKWGYGL